MQGDTVLHKRFLFVVVPGQNKRVLCGAASALFLQLAQLLAPIPERYDTPHDDRNLAWSTAICIYCEFAQKDPRTGPGVSTWTWRQLGQVQRSRQ